MNLSVHPIHPGALRKHDVGGHKQAMTGLYVGALLIAGAFTFVPGRLMHTVFFG